MLEFLAEVNTGNEKLPLMLFLLHKILKALTNQGGPQCDVPSNTKESEYYETH